MTPASDVSDVRPHRARTITAVVLLVLTVLLSGVSIAAVSVNRLLTDTDHYVAAVAPVAQDPAVQDALTTRISDDILSRTEFGALTGPTTRAVTEGVGAFVRSDRFASLWAQANRRAHAVAVAVVTGDHGVDAVRIDDTGTVAIELGPIVDAARTALTERGVPLIDRAPDVDARLVLFESPELATARRAANGIDLAATVLPWLGFAAAAAAIVVAPPGRRLRTLSRAGIAVVAGAGLLALTVWIVRDRYLAGLLPSDVEPVIASTYVDALLGTLRTATVVVAGAGVVVAVGARTAERVTARRSGNVRS
ncbi:hypothetical protein [Prescottella sp. R16]|uniref:hypothetical protein n=1 Tax=Prescottella sp. R16 TaxID=3064529 RepID=UPI00272E9EC4|nr:hypothetical protein [Prescottella sp. R16]